MMLFAHSIFLLIFSYTVAQLISVQLHHMKSSRHELAEVGTDIEDIQRFMRKNKSARTNDTVALYKYLDSEFYGLLQIGHPAQTFKVIFDTTYANVWVTSAKCSILNLACLVHKKYKSKDSTTYIENGTKFTQQYGSNKLEGFLSTDVIHVAHLDVTNATFAEITSLPMPEVLTKSDGVVGLAFDTVSVDKVEPLFYSLVTRGLISKAVFSVYINRDHSSSKGGSLMFGGSEPRHYNGSFTYLSVINTGLWSVKMDRMHIDKGNKTFPFCMSGCIVHLDTSTITISAPAKNVTKINDLLGVTTTFLGRGKIPCNIVQKLPPITFVFTSKPFILKPDDYVQEMVIHGMTICLSSFVINENSNTDWVIGGAFFSQYFVEFDMEKYRVGFALKR